MRCPRCKIIGSRPVLKLTYDIGWGRTRTNKVCSICTVELKSGRKGLRTVYTKS